MSNHLDDGRLEVMVIKFLQARSREESREVLLEHPELLGDEAGAFLEQLIASARAEGHRGGERFLREHADLLRRCREVGMKEAFMEETWQAGNSEISSIMEELSRRSHLHEMPHRIELCIRALNLISIQENAPLWASLHQELGECLAQNPYDDRAENIERAIEHFEQALQIYTKDFPEHWAKIQSDLGLAYIYRNKDDKAKNIEKAIEYFELALQVQSQKPFSEDWAITQNGLGLAYSDRIREQRAENIEKAVEHFEQASKVYWNFGERWASIQNNLGRAYINRISGDKAENIERAIEHFGQAQKFYSRRAFSDNWAMIQTNLGIAYRDRIKGVRIENIEKAIEHFRDALTVSTPEGNPGLCKMAARFLGNLCFDSQRWEEASEPYSLAIEATSILYRSSLFLSSKEAVLAETGDLYRRAAYALARAGQPVQAAVALERGRARGLGDAIARDKADLEVVKAKDEEAYQLFRQVSDRLRRLEQAEVGGKDEPRDREALRLLRLERSTAQKALDDAVTRIRSIPGYEKFLMEPDWPELEKAWNEGKAPLVYLVTTLAGSLALVLHGGEDGLKAEPIQKDGFKEDELFRILDDWFAALDKWNLNYKLFCGEVDKTSERLWNGLMGSVVEYLMERGFQEAVLIPTGLLALLPIHAAWIKENDRKVYALDRVTFSFAPSALTLNHARKIARDAAKKHLLAVDSLKIEINEESLSYGPEVIQAAKDHFSKITVLCGRDAAKNKVLQALRDKDVDVVSFFCHGTANIAEPAKSGLLMTDGKILTIRDLFQLQLSGDRLATLSACESGVSGTRLPDEVVSLPSAFIRAGFAGVVASLWPVDESSTAKLMAKFYDLWLKQNLPPAHALRQAQQWLRDQWKRIDNHKEISLEHPYYWAAFYMTGA